MGVFIPNKIGLEDPNEQRQRKSVQEWGVEVGDFARPPPIRTRGGVSVIRLRVRRSEFAGNAQSVRYDQCPADS